MGYGEPEVRKGKPRLGKGEPIVRQNNPGVRYIGKPPKLNK